MKRAMCPSNTASSSSKPSPPCMIVYLQAGDWIEAKCHLESWDVVANRISGEKQESPVREQDEQGNTSLHVVLHQLSCKSHSVDLIKTISELFQMMIDCDREAVLIPNFKGELPIHLACHKGLSDQEAIIDSLLSAVQHSLGGLNYGTSNSCRLPLHEACAQGIHLHYIQKLIQRFPNAAAYADVEGRMPLHLACSNLDLNQSYTCIKDVIDACPRALHVPDQNGNFPLHLACGSAAAPEIVQLLIKRDPRVVQLQNLEIDLPIHLACRCHDLADEVLPMLLNHFPSSLEAPGKISGLPLHEACGNPKMSLKAVKTLVKSYPKSVRISAGGNEKGVNLPLHFACDAKVSKDIIEFLLREYPQAAEFPDPDGLLPIHLAVSPGDGGSTCPPEVIKTLISSYPSGVSVATRSGNLPLHEACIRTFQDTDYSDLEEVVHMLVEAFPAARYCLSKSGKRPLDIAYACFAREKFLTLLTTATHAIRGSKKDTPRGVAGKRRLSDARIIKHSFAEERSIFDSLCKSAENAMGFTSGDLTILTDFKNKYHTQSA